MTKTDENLKAAFAGESQANRMYLAFARKAEQEGLTQIAKLFNAAAEAETIHALNHLRVMGQVKSTLENLNTAISGETHEFKEMYPADIIQAKEDENKQAIVSFDMANKVEQIHATLYQKAVDALRNKTELPKVDYYVCGICGNTVENQAPERCPVCGASKERFFKPA
jgi:rubrerythrin